MPKMTQIQFGEYGPTIASPFISDELVTLLLRTPVFHKQYAKGPDGEYGNVFLSQPTIIRFGELDCPFFEGTEKEYRDQPPKPLTHADLVVQLSAANDQIAALEETVRSLNRLLDERPSLAEAAE